MGLRRKNLRAEPRITCVPGKAEREGQVPLRMPLQPSVIGHPSGQLSELGTDRGEPGTGLGVEAAVGE